MFCNNCGTKNPDGAKYCSACGARLNIPETAVSGRDSDSPVRSDKSDPDKENFRNKLRRSIEKDTEGILDFVVIQVPYNDFVQFLPMEGGGFYVEFAVGSTDSSSGRYSQCDKLYRQYGYKYGTGGLRSQSQILKRPEHLNLRISKILLPEKPNLRYFRQKMRTI